MYISSWLIVLLGIIAILFFFYRKKRQKAKLEKITSTSRLSEKYIVKLVRKHYKKIYYTSDLKKIRPAMERLAEELNLGSRLFEFIDTIRHYPRWYSEKQPTRPRFESSAIRELSISSRKCCESELINFFPDLFKFKKEDELIEYKFTANSYNFILIICPPQFTYNCYYPVLILQNQGLYPRYFPKTYLFIKLYYKIDITEDFCYYELEEFEYGDWLEYLIDKMVETREEARTKKF